MPLRTHHAFLGRSPETAGARQAAEKLDETAVTQVGKQLQDVSERRGTVVVGWGWVCLWLGWVCWLQLRMDGWVTLEAKVATEEGSH